MLFLPKKTSYNSTWLGNPPYIEFESSCWSNNWGQVICSNLVCKSFGKCTSSPKFFSGMWPLNDGEKTLVPWWNLNIEAGKPMSDVGPSNGLATKGTSSSVRTTSSLLLKKMFVVKSKAEIWKVWNATPRWMVTIFPSHWIWCDDVIHRAIDHHFGGVLTP